MVTRLVNQLVERFLHPIINNLQLVHNVAPISALSNSRGGLNLKDLFDGFLLATPKHRTPIRKIWSRKYGDDNWKYGTKLFKSKRNIITCMECGNFHEVHTICRACFNKTQDESKEAIEVKANTLWFDTNLVQPAAHPKKLVTGEPSANPSNITIKIKE